MGRTYFCDTATEHCRSRVYSGYLKFFVSFLCLRIWIEQSRSMGTNSNCLVKEKERTCHFVLIGTKKISETDFHGLVFCKVAR